MSHHPNVERLLAGTDWRLLRDEEAESFNQAYERDRRQWLARNEGEANTQMQSSRVYDSNHPFHVPFVKHEEVEERLAPARVLIWCGIVLALCVAGFSTLLYFFR